MRYRVYIARAAKRDVLDAADYIEFSLKNARAADCLVETAWHEMNSLGDSPEKFQVVDDLLLASWGIRYCIVNNYLAFYIVDHARQMVIVVRFLYQRSNWAAILRQGISLV